MNTELMDELERQMLEVVGMLAIGHNKIAAQQLVTMIHGLRIVNDACKAYPMPLATTEQANFYNPTEVPR